MIMKGRTFKLCHGRHFAQIRHCYALLCIFPAEDTCCLTKLVPHRAILLVSCHQWTLEIYTRIRVCLRILQKH